MSKSRYLRKTPNRTSKDVVLVVCGGKTERIYFDTFNRVFRPSLGSISIVTDEKAKNPKQIVEHAIKIKKSKDCYNAAWCVFDKDDSCDFDEAIDYARRNGISTAFSNQAFEVWFINLFRQLSSAMHRNKYKKELNKWLMFQDYKSPKVIDKVCSVLLTEDKIKTAIFNSRLGYEKHKAACPYSRFSEYESCTTVYALAGSLLDWLE
jgi:hypothetical protein